MDPQVTINELKEAVKNAFPDQAGSPAIYNMLNIVAKLMYENGIRSTHVIDLMRLFKHETPEQEERHLTKFYFWYKNDPINKDGIEIIRKEYPEAASKGFKKAEPEPPGMEIEKAYLRRNPDPRVIEYLLEDLRKYPIEEVKKNWRLLTKYIATEPARLAKAEELRKQYGNTA